MTGVTVEPAVRSAPGGRRRRSRHVSLVVGAALTVLFAAVAVTSLFYTPHDITAVDPAQRLLGVGDGGYALGTDHLGRDVVSQLMVGARTSITVALLGTTMGLVVGTVAGLASASRSGLLDEGVMRAADVLLAFPGVVIALVLAATIGGGMTATVVALAVFFSPSFTRVIRSAALRVLQEEFVTAARIYGRRRVYVLVRHVLPNISSVVIVQFTLYFAIGILVEAGLSYLGVGTQRPGVSFGLMLQEAQQYVGASGWLAVWPGVGIVFAVLGLNLLGDGLRDVLDPKLNGGGR